MRARATEREGKKRSLRFLDIRLMSSFGEYIYFVLYHNLLALFSKLRILVHANATRVNLGVIPD